MFDRHFTLPIALAAAIHGALFFGSPIRPPNLPAKKLTEKPVPTIAMTRREDEPDPAPLEAIAETGAKASPDQYRPTTDDVPTIPKLTDFTVPVVKTPVVEFRGHMRVIPTDIGPKVGTGSGTSIGDIIGAMGLDSPPKTRVQTTPVYPFEAKRDGRRGEVLVEFVVDETGRVVDPRVVQSTDRVFEEATLRAVSKWRFEPGRRHGRVVRFRMVQPVVFNLSE
ncbi:MAG: energy transducer TonB [Opitutaceae bacterium]|nr:energy transducer TonB [Opitutaceae bacterium]